MIITDEELLALLDAEEHEAAGFCPIVLYALDGVSHALASATTLPSYVTLHRTQPDACWQWEGLFAAGAIALYDPAAHQQADYFPKCSRIRGFMPSARIGWEGSRPVTVTGAAGWPPTR